MKSTTRTVRRGARPTAAMTRAASSTIAQPAPSSMAPVPRSHESRCAPSSTTSLARSRPGTSPTTFADSTSPSNLRRQHQLHAHRARRRAPIRPIERDSASSALTAAAGIFGVASS